MSFDWLPNKPIYFDELKEKLRSVTIHITSETILDNDAVCITDGKNGLWAYRSRDGRTMFKSYKNFVNNVSVILEYLADLFDITWVSDGGCCDWEPEFARVAQDYDYVTIRMDELSDLEIPDGEKE